MTNSLIYSINVDLIPEFVGSRRRICQRIGRELVRHFPYAEQTLPWEHAFVDEPTPETGRLPLPEGHKGRQGYFHQSSSQVCASLFYCLFLMLSNINLFYHPCASFSSSLGFWSTTWQKPLWEDGVHLLGEINLFSFGLHG